MHKFYIPEALAGVRLAPWFDPTQSVVIFGEGLPPNFFSEVIQTKLSEAEAIVLPNNFKAMDAAATAYVQKYLTEAKTHKIPLFVFSLGDYTDKVPFDPEVTVFRLSAYRSKILPNTVLMPTRVGDLGRDGITIRSKTDLPVVSFCGKAGFSSVREHAATLLRWLSYELLGMFNPIKRAHIRGIYWRQWMLDACSASVLVQTNFIVRKTFSGASRTVEVSPEQARKEFIDSINNADFVLTPKGDGNYSNRFLETLSLGRIPVLVDTDVVLPFEDRIAYSKIVVRVPMNKVDQTPQYIREFYDALSQEEWQERQRLARETFEKYLRQDVFLKSYFS
jgi:hypothetical protein